MTQEQWKAEHQRLQEKFRKLHESLTPKAKKQDQKTPP